MLLLIYACMRALKWNIFHMYMDECNVSSHYQSNAYMISKYIELVYYEIVIDCTLWVLTNCFLFNLNQVAMFIWQCRGHHYQLFQRRSSSQKRMMMKNDFQKLTDVVNFIQWTWFVVFRVSIQQSMEIMIIWCIVHTWMWYTVAWMKLKSNEFFWASLLKSWGFVLRQ